MYIVSNRAGTIEADFVMRGRQYPVLHIHTHKCDPLTAYQMFGVPENNYEITSVEKLFEPTEEFVQGKTYYEGNGYEYYPTEDTVMNPEKTYYEIVDGETTVYHDFTDVQSIGKSPLMPEYGEILIFLTRPIADYD